MNIIRIADTNSSNHRAWLSDLLLKSKNERSRKLIFLTTGNIAIAWLMVRDESRHVSIIVRFLTVKFLVRFVTLSPYGVQLRTFALYWNSSRFFSLKKYATYTNLLQSLFLKYCFPTLELFSQTFVVRVEILCSSFLLKDFHGGAFVPNRTSPVDILFYELFAFDLLTSTKKPTC